MHKSYFTFFLSLLFFTSCEKIADKPYNERITGTWINTLVDDIPVETNKKYVMKFDSKGNELYSAAYQIDQTNRKWLDGTSFKYTVENNWLNIEGVNAHNDKYKMLFVLEYTGEDRLVYQVPSFTINNQESADNKVYTCKKITNDLKDNLMGLWFGSGVEPGSNDTVPHYWEFFQDGRYDFYIQNDLGNWIKKEDQAGKWFLYGNFLALNFQTMLSSSTLQEFNCWDISFEENRMTWEAIREHNVYAGYWFKKAEAIAPSGF